MVPTIMVTALPQALDLGAFQLVPARILADAEEELPESG